MLELDVTKHQDLQQLWARLNQKKSSIETLAEQYAEWTLPYMFPPTGSENVELQNAADSLGAQAVNHLSNKVVAVLFPPQQLFFRLHVDEKMKMMAETALSSQAPDMEAVKAGVSKAMLAVDQQLASTEKQVQDQIDMVQYRPQAVHAAKLLIIMGNALIYHPDGRPVQVYNLRDYCVQRDLTGTPIQIMTKECKAFETFNPDVQSKLRINGRLKNQNYVDQDDVTIYTLIRLENDGKYHVYQCANDVMLDTAGAMYPKDKLRWIPLTWNLVRGEDYGRGLVGEYAGAFHAVNVLTSSLLNIAAIMGDIKFLVNPQSLVDVPTLNKAKSGSYHPGKEGDVSVINLNAKQGDAQFIATLIERYERQIAQAFLLNSALTRDAERVTAEEIRAQANELEMSNGGIYSRLASTWQAQTAVVLLDQIGFEGLDDGITPKIVTGMDSLSRVAELDNLRWFLADLALLNGVPEDIRASIRAPDFIKVIGTARQVDYQQFTKTVAELQAEQAQMQQQEQAMEAQKGNTQVQAAAAKEAVKE